MANSIVSSRLLAELADATRAPLIHVTDATPAFMARRRHLDALARASAALETGHERLVVDAAGELLAEELRLAQAALGEITGSFTSDDLLGAIFSSFCIGK